MPIGSNSTSTSPTRFNDNNSNSNVNGASDRKNSLDSNSSSGSGGGGKLATMSYDPTSYIQRARVTRPAPPKPSCNPMQFVQIKPCNLYQTAQEQLKKAEEVKKVKEIKKEEPEDWQSNLDNWKSSRRKRVEHIIDRVVEVKKLELEEHDRTRRKSKTFSEMLEERSSRRTKLASLSVYTEDESNDLSDFGIGTSSTSGKSSLSEDYDNHSVMSDNVDTEKSTSDLLINHHHHHHHHHHNHHHHHQHDNNDQLNHDENGMSTNRDYISSPGYETSSSTAPTNSPDPCEYTYEGAIQDYKTRISRAQSNNNNNNNTNNGFNRSTVSSPYSKDSTPERNMTETNNYTLSTTKRLSGTKIENRLTNFELKSSSSSSATSTNDLSVPKKDLPKVDILKRRELFEKENSNNASTESISSVSNNQKRLSGDFTTTKSIRERLSNLEKRPTIEQESKQKTNRLSGDITSLKDRLQNLERQTSVTEKNPKIDVPVVPLKDRLSSLQSAVQKEEIKKPVLLVDEHQLEILKKEELEKQHILRKEMLDDDNLSSSQEILNLQDESNVDTDREDSGIHTTDVSCSVSQTDEQPDLVNEESHHHINAEDGLCQNIDRQLQNTSENHDKCEESAPCVPDVIRNSTNEPMSPNKLIDDQQQQQQQQSPDDQNINTTSPEPLVDQEASVSLSLSESPTISSSQQTIIFNGKTASETGAGSLENITSISQLSVEGALGVDYNCSNKHSVVGNGSTNTSFTYGKNSKFDTDKTGKEAKKTTVYGTQFKFDFTNNGNNNNPKTKTNEKSFENSKFILKTDSVVEDKINIEKWIEQNLEQSKNLENDVSTLSLPSDIDIESSKLSHTNNTYAHENNTSITKPNFDPRSYGEVIFDSKLMSPKTSKSLINDFSNVNSIEQSPHTSEIEIKTSNISQNSPELEKKSKIESESIDEVETVCLKIRPQSLKYKLKAPTKISSSKTSSDEKRQTIIETCEKVNVHDLLDPAHIPTPFIDVSLETIKASNPNEITATIKIPRSQNSPTKIPTLTKPLAPSLSSSPSSSTLLSPITSPKYKSAPNSPFKEFNVPENKISGKQNSDIPVSKSLPNSTASTPDGSRNGIIVAKFEIVETKIKVTSNDSNHQRKPTELSLPKIPKSPKSPKSPILSPKSPKINTKTHPDLKPKNIFDFLRKNFSSNHDNDNSNNIFVDNDDGDIGAVSVDNSKFYIPLSVNTDDDLNVDDGDYGSGNNGVNDVNIKITKTIKTDRIVEKADSIDSDTTMTNEINQLLDEELLKLATTSEDTRL